MSENYKHITVLKHEAIHSLNLRSDGIYLDGTFGRGGHSQLILSKLGKCGQLLAIDRDLEAVEAAQSINDSRFSIVHGTFSYIREYVVTRNLLGKIDGILLDLGISSPQIDNPNRGFSFMRDGPLDMRMDNTCGQSTAEWLCKASKKTISWVLKNLGEERFYERIAQAIFEKNKNKMITRTCELSEIIISVMPFHDKHKHPATRSFHAIRMYINNELEELNRILIDSLELLNTGGRLSVISFNSLEDRLVKNFIHKYSHKAQIQCNLPLTEKQIFEHTQHRLQLKAIDKIKPSEKEIRNNPRARSSILRIAEKLPI